MNIMTTKIRIIILLYFLCFQPLVLAQEKQEFNTFQSNSNIQSDINNNPSVKAESNGQAPLSEESINTPDNKDQAFPASNPKDNLFKSINSGLAKLNPIEQKAETKPEPKIIHLRLFQREFDIKRPHLTTILAILGLLGTFFGICSTWTIYLLTRKHNDPLVIDRKECALRYIEELYKIKDCFLGDKLKRLDLLLDNALIGNLSQSEIEELKNFILIYNKSTSIISRTSMEEAHNRYKKHIRRNKADFFSSLMAHYKMIEIDARNYISNETYTSHYNPESTDFLAEENIILWKNKVATMLAFQKKVLTALKVLNKDLKR